MSRVYIFLLILPYLAYATISMAVDQGFSYIPGPFETVDLIAQNSKLQLNELNKLTSKNLKNFEEFKSAKKIVINPHFMFSLLLNTDEKYLFLASQNNCLFYHILFLGLEKTNSPFLKNTILVDIFYSDGNKTTAVVLTNDFLKFQFQSQCFENKDTIRSFSGNNLNKTLSLLNITPPKTINECQEQFNSFLKRNDAIHLCSMFSTEIKNNSLANLITPLQKTYLENICSNLYSKDNFCNIYLKDNYWDKVLTNEKSEHPLVHICQGILKKHNVEKSDFPSCIKRLKTNKELCHFNNSYLYPSLSPRPDCDQISKALLNSKYIPDYDDCPGKILNEGIINLTRVDNFFRPKKNEKNVNDCHIRPLKNFIKLTLNKTYHPIWNFNICYHDPIQDEEVCYPFYYGENLKDPLSEVFILNKIMNKLKSNSSIQCQLTESKDYNPNFLSYKRGCFLVYSKNRCTALSCPKKIIFNEKRLSDIKYKEGTLFNYVATDRISNQYALINVLSDEIKFSTVPIKTNTALKNINKKIKSIIHGIGCAEDIYPSFFPQKSLNGCSPLPFIIDGYLYENQKDLVIIRTAIDDIYNPRIIPWHQIYTSVNHYSNTLPLAEWTLYEIKL